MTQIIDRPRYTCTLGGALAAVRGFADKVVPIIHAAPGCGANLGYTIGQSAAYAGSGYASVQNVASSCVTEKEIVFGGEERLREEIQSALEVMDGDLYVVLTACMVEMIGDNVASVVKSFSQCGKKIVFAETGGFRGDAYKGYDLLLAALVRQYIPPCPKKQPYLVNLWGIPPILDVFWERDLTILRNLLEELGCQVNTFWGEGEGLTQLQRAGQACLNLVLSDIYGANTIAAFQEIHQIPSLRFAFPIGEKATSQFLYEVGNALNIPQEQVASLVSSKQKIYYHYFDRLIEVYTDSDFQRYSVIVGDANYAPAVSRFLADELGWLPELVVITNQLTKEEEETLRQRFSGYDSGFLPHVFFDPNTCGVMEHFQEIWPQPNGCHKYYHPFSPAIVLGSSQDREFAQAIDAQHLSISYPIANRMILAKGYSGYEGGLNLLEDLMSRLVEGR